MYQRTDVWIAKPSAGGSPMIRRRCPNPSQLPSPTPDLLNDPLFLIGPAAPLTGNVLVTATVLRTAHGPVQAFATVNGQPVAYVRQRSTFFHEPDGAPAFLKMNSPDLVQDAASFQQAMGTALNSTFNWFYVDSHDIAYEVSGNYPIRAAGIDYDLPYFATGQWDWQNWNPRDWTADRMPQSQLPKDLDPAKGYMTSWNNAQAPGWNSADAELSYGPLHRSQPLDDRIAADAIDHADRARAVHGGRGHRRSARRQARARDRAAARRLHGRCRTPISGSRCSRQWNAAGAHRRDLDGDGVYDHAAAVALMDRWWVPLTRHRVRHARHRRARRDAAGRHDAPGPVGSAFIAGWYGIVHKDLRGAIAGAPIAPFSRVYCGNGVLADCRTAVRNSLAAAVRGARPEPRDLGRRTRPAIASISPRPAPRRSPTWTGSTARPSSRWSSTGSMRRAPTSTATASPPTRTTARSSRTRARRTRGGLATATPDGIGDACQCGDVTGNGIVNGQDAQRDPAPRRSAPAEPAVRGARQLRRHGQRPVQRPGRERGEARRARRAEPDVRPELPQRHGRAVPPGL